MLWPHDDLLLAAHAHTPSHFWKITLQIFGDRLTSACFGTIFNTCCGVGNIHLPKSIFSLETNQPVKGRLGNHQYVSLWSFDLDFDFLEWYTWHQEQRRGGGSTPQERATADFAAAAVGKWGMHARCRRRWWEAEDFKAFPPSLLALAKSTLTPYTQPSHCVHCFSAEEKVFWDLNSEPRPWFPRMSQPFCLQMFQRRAKSELGWGLRFMSCLLFPAHSRPRRGSWVNTSKNVWRQQFTNPTLFSLTQKLRAREICIYRNLLIL